jgi:hypothetical protein
VPFDEWWVYIIVYGIFWSCIFINCYIVFKTIRFLKQKIEDYEKEKQDQTTSSQQFYLPTSSADTRDLNKTETLTNNISTCKNVEKIKRVVKKLYIFPFITIIIWLLASLNRGYELIYYNFYLTTDEVPNEWRILKLMFITLQSVCMSLRGTIYVMVYLGNYEKSRKTIKRILKKIKRFICNKHPKSYLDSNFHKSESTSAN